MGGIFPCSHTHDTAGPLARTVVVLAMSLDATVGADPEDAATKIVAGRQLPRFAAALDKRALQGSRLGVLTSFFNDCDFETAHIVRSAVDRMTEEGATTREVSLPRDMSNPTGLFGAAVWNFEFKFDVIDYLAKIPNAPVHSMAEILERGL